MVKKHVKPTKANPEGGIVEKEAPIHVSNVMHSMIQKAKVASRKEQKLKLKMVKKLKHVKKQMQKRLTK